MNEYIQSCVDLLRARRPELLQSSRGRWEGPSTDDAAAGLVWRGPKQLLVLVSPWDTLPPDHPGADAALWLHVSVSRPDRCPTYDELTEVRNRLFRPGDTVLHVWPPAGEHFSLHPYCLHLWTPLDGSRPIPDLRGVGGGV